MSDVHDAYKKAIEGLNIELPNKGFMPSLLHIAKLPGPEKPGHFELGYTEPTPRELQLQKELSELKSQIALTQPIEEALEKIKDPAINKGSFLAVCRTVLYLYDEVFRLKTLQADQPKEKDAKAILKTLSDMDKTNPVFIIAVSSLVLGCLSIAVTILGLIIALRHH